MSNSAITPGKARNRLSFVILSFIAVVMQHDNLEMVDNCRDAADAPSIMLGQSQQARL